MKATLDIDDELLVRARRHAANTGQSLRDVIEDGLRRVLSPALKAESVFAQRFRALSTPPVEESYRLPDHSCGDPCADDPLARYSWEDLSKMIYDDEP
ncbi:hypothetical protein [Candidatus Palauibacter sp.]|uniref:hypothetical protein n=1 Tax=Candidatus Palauibacter sp. TaxID=3101350 RepID=UPI003B01DFBE